jgi:hypothetical protein
MKGQVCHQEMLHALLVIMNIGFKKNIYEKIEIPSDIYFNFIF